MNFWEKLSLNPAYCGFEGAFLDMLHIKKSYLHIRFCCEGDLYEKYQDDLRHEYLDPVEHELLVDTVFLSPAILQAESHMPESIRFGDVYLVSSLTKDPGGVYSLRFYTHEGEQYCLKFTFRECIAKPYAEMDCSFYYNHPELFDKPFSLKEFMGRKV